MKLTRLSGAFRIGLILLGVLLIGLMIIIFSLDGFYNKKIKYNLETLNTEVISAEIALVYYDDNEELVFDNVNPISKDDLEELFTDVSKITFTIMRGNPKITHGEIIKLNYVDRYEIISTNTILTYFFKEEKFYQNDVHSKGKSDIIISKWNEKYL